MSYEVIILPLFVIFVIYMQIRIYVNRSHATYLKKTVNIQHLDTLNIFELINLKNELFSDSTVMWMFGLKKSYEEAVGLVDTVIIKKNQEWQLKQLELSQIEIEAKCTLCNELTGPVYHHGCDRCLDVNCAWYIPTTAVLTDPIIDKDLTEAAKSNYDNKTARIPVPSSQWINSAFLQIQNFKEGAKWQQERQIIEMEKQNIPVVLENTDPVVGIDIAETMTKILNEEIKQSLESELEIPIIDREFLGQEETVIGHIPLIDVKKQLLAQRKGILSDRDVKEVLKVEYIKDLDKYFVMWTDGINRNTAIIKLDK